MKFWQTAITVIAMGCSGEAGAKTINVNPDSLQNALLAAKGGERIVLAPGQYGDVVWTKRTFKPAVMIDASQARFTYIAIRDMDGLILSGGTVIGPRTQTYAVQVRSSRNISIRQMNITGSRGGIGLMSSQDLLIEHNEFDGIRSDGINVAAVQRAKILYNDCRNFTPTRSVYDDKGKSLQQGDHPDCIQGWAVIGQPPPSDIEIIGNTAHGLGRVGIYREWMMAAAR